MSNLLRFIKIYWTEDLAEEVKGGKILKQLLCTKPVNLAVYMSIYIFSSFGTGLQYSKIFLHVQWLIITYMSY